MYFIVLITILSVNCFAVEKSLQLTNVQDIIPQYLGRFRRDSPYSGYKNYMPGAVQPSVVVMTSGVPNSMYRGSSYGVQGASYGAQGAAYGTNSVPAVVVNMPESSSCKRKKKKKNTQY